MGAVPLRLLGASIALTLGLALAPVAAAEAAPARATHVVAVGGTDAAAAGAAERRLAAPAQVVTDSGTRGSGAGDRPLWLLVLLAPILLGGVIATRATLHRLR